ncbi:MAG TPA: translation initiation factor IF-2 subunit beta [Candidatus Nanoarchaeia archaeon]|nr:translation initiation factor IF-2 subunit beta [Candidatus Nanoarchaeia archaeon]
MQFDYQQLLREGKAKLPERSISKERFEVPSVTGHVEGNKTIISNFSIIVSALQRDAEHLLKYLQRELATPATIDGPRLVLGRKISSSSVNQKIQQYAKDFVVCKECGKPDTKLIREDRVLFLKCTACGAKEPVKAKL